MLYLPWRNEETDILVGYMSFKAGYDDLSDDVLVSDWRYSQNASIIDEAYSQLQQQGQLNTPGINSLLEQRTIRPETKCRGCKI